MTKPIPDTDPLKREPPGKVSKVPHEDAGIDEPGATTGNNPGHTNPSHNTPGHARQDQTGQQAMGQPGQDQTQSYPGIKGSKAKDLQQDSAIDKQEAEQVKDSAGKKVDTARDERSERQEAEGQKATQFDGNPNPQGAPSSPLKPKDDTPMKLEKSEGPRDDQ